MFDRLFIKVGIAFIFFFPLLLYAQLDEIHVKKGQLLESE